MSTFGPDEISVPSDVQAEFSGNLSLPWSLVVGRCLRELFGILSVCVLRIVFRRVVGLEKYDNEFFLWV